MTLYSSTLTYDGHDPTPKNTLTLSPILTGISDNFQSSIESFNCYFCVYLFVQVDTCVVLSKIFYCPTLPYPTLPYPALRCPVLSCPKSLSTYLLTPQQSGDYGEETYSLCTCKNDTGNCWDLSLWSTEGKTYEDYIRRLTSSLIKDCYAQRRQLRKNIRNGRFNLFYKIQFVFD